MALGPCVRTILCSLSAAVLGALSGIIQAQKAALNAQLAAIKSQLLILNVATVPVELGRNIANEVLEQARAAATLVPLDLIAECADMGDLNVNLVESIDSTLREINDFADDLNRLLSFSEELAALEAEIVAIIEQFDQILLIIQECGQT